MKSLKLKAPLPTEDDEAQCLMQWAKYKRYSAWAISDFLIMIPNGAVLAGDAKQRAIQMARMKRCGFKPGVADYFLMIANNGFHGLFLELKRRELGVVSDAQYFFQSMAVVRGYSCVISKGWESAKAAIEGYLDMDFTP